MRQWVIQHVSRWNRLLALLIGIAQSSCAHGAMVAVRKSRSGKTKESSRRHDRQQDNRKAYNLEVVFSMGSAMPKNENDNGRLFPTRWLLSQTQRKFSGHFWPRTEIVTTTPGVVNPIWSTDTIQA